MKCENCGNNEANVRYTQIINGVKKEMHLCEECARELGIGADLSFNMSMDIPSFFGEIFDEYNNLNLLPSFGTTLKEEKCNKCGMTYDEFASTGRFGCPSCYDIFSYRLDPILKSIQGNNRHVGRKSRTIDSGIVKKMEEQKEELKTKVQEKVKEKDKISELKNNLKKAVKEERYEDAAKLRDEINSLEKNNK